MDCVFCKIVNGEISAKTIDETNKSLAFLDALPLTKGHSLVIPKNHYEKIQDMTPEDNADLFETVRHVMILPVLFIQCLNQLIKLLMTR